MQHQSSQNGVAIISALLVIALGTITVVAIMSRQQLDLHRERNEVLIQNARSFANAGESFASALLFIDKEAGLRENTDSLEDDWAQLIPPISIDQMSLQGCIVDMQGRLNVNNIVDVEGNVDPVYFDMLKRLFGELGIAQEKADAVLDWIDTDLNATIPEGAEDDYYTGLTPPYRTKNGPISSVSEIQLMKGFSPSVPAEKEDYELLLPHIAALPTTNGKTQVNVNTATPQVIASLSEFVQPLAPTLSRWDTEKYADYPECEDIFDLAAEETQVLGETKDIDPYLFVQDFIAEADSDQGEEVVPPNSISVSSKYFQIRVDVLGDTAKLTQYSLLERDDAGRSKVVARSRDTL